MFKDKRYQEICGIVLILLGAFLFFSLISFSVSDYRSLGTESPVGNILGPLGATASHALRSVLGISSYIIVGTIIFTGVITLRTGDPASTIERVFTLFFLSVTTASLAGYISPAVPQLSGGYAGCGIAYFLNEFVGPVGAILMIIILNIIALILLGVFSMTTLIELIKTRHLNMEKVHAFLDKNQNVNNIVQRVKSSVSSLKAKKDEDISLNTATDEETEKPKKERRPWITKETIWVDKHSSKLFFGFKKAKEANTAEIVPAIAALPDYSSTDSEIKLYAENQEGQFESYTAESVAVLAPTAVIVESEVAFEEEFELVEDIESQVQHAFDTFIDSDDEQTEFIEEPEPSVPVAVIRREDAGPRFISIEEDTTEDNEKDKKTELFIKEKTDIANAVKRVFSDITLKKTYAIPTTYLQSSPSSDKESWQNEIRKNSELLVSTLAEFGIETAVAKVNRGPVITLYELHIAPGIKVQKIVGLSDDIAMALAASRVRIVAPIPGKSAVGVEIPNTVRENVTLGDIIKAAEYKSEAGALKVALGKDILGKPLTLDLKRLPHLLIAGATGSGKSVCVNTIITSLIYNYDPNYVRFILVDPKMVELQLYNGMPHLLTPVITEPQMTPAILKWAIHEMERRYRLLSSMNTRDIERYNEKVNERHFGEEKLPYIVIIIDELADLMMVASKDVEGYITRLAQKARAIGIHLVLATQRPSVDVITGVIKANFPARIAFQVAQKTDSRTIIDQNGAEKLLGQGDMLYQSPISAYPTRIQGAFISEDEIAGIVGHLERYGEPVYIDIEQALFDASEDLRDNDDNDDELFVDALKIIEEDRKASASYLQRRLSIGYNRAARMIELMEDRGYIGPQQGSKPREIFV